MKTIKSINTRRFNVDLVEGDGGLYYIRYDNYKDEPQMSEGMQDLNTALHLFDLKIAELEGN